MAEPTTGLRLPAIDTRPDTARSLRRRSVANLLRMGHCAPTVMQTLLDASDAEAPWLVKLTAGLPGGIGNTGGECGGVTAPLILFGLRHAHDPARNGVPVVIEKGHDYLQRFAACEGTTLCREIRGDARLPTRCIGVIREAVVLYAKTSATEGATPLAGERRAAYSRLCAHWGQRQFHCAHAVLRRLGPVIPATPELFDATSAFVGGTACSGGTCSALTAGVMALGLRLGDIERSRWRVLRMVATMAVSGHAFADDLNAFNRIMNLGHRLAAWFTTEFGSTQCRTLTGCDFASVAEVNGFIEGDGVARCEALATRVAERVRTVVDAAHVAPPHADSSRSP